MPLILPAGVLAALTNVGGIVHVWLLDDACQESEKNPVQIRIRSYRAPSREMHLAESAPLTLLHRGSASWDEMHHDLRRYLAQSPRSWASGLRTATTESGTNHGRRPSSVADLRFGACRARRGQHLFVDQHHCFRLRQPVLNPSSAPPPTVCPALPRVGPSGTPSDNSDHGRHPWVSVLRLQ